MLYAAEQLAAYRSADNPAGANLYFDTMRFSAPLLRYLGEVLGPQRIIVRSDWPIHRDAQRAHIEARPTDAGFSTTEQELIRVGNARTLFRLPVPVT